VLSGAKVNVPFQDPKTTRTARYLALYSHHSFALKSSVHFPLMVEEFPSQGNIYRIWETI
jgi:hypothetical protein